MFVTITKGSPAVLQHPIDNRSGNLKVALHEIVYRINWFNISEAKENNWIQTQDQHGNVIKSYTLPDGYYGICSLKEKLNEYGIMMKLNPANLKITLTFKVGQQREQYNFAGGLAKLLGFTTKNTQIFNFPTTEKNNVFEGRRPINLASNSLLFAHLDELNTDENLCNGRPSTLLRVLPTGNAAYCDPQIERFTNLQFKKLSSGYFESLNIRIANETGEEINCDELYVVMEIINQ